MIRKRCSTCKKMKRTTDFINSPKKKGGFGCTCKPCRSYYNQKYRQSPRYRSRYRAQIEKYKKNNPTKVRASNMIYNMKDRSLKAGKRFYFNYFTLDRVINMLDTQKRCLSCNIIFNCKYNSGNKKNNSPSFDRVDSSKGYTPKNVRLICYRCNIVKRDSTITDLRNLLRYSKRYGGKP